jgi:RNA polymerase sigma-70 factor (ECF subfamily)
MKDNSVPLDVTIQSSLASSVLVRAQGGDGEAFAKITALFGGLVYHWCRRAGLSPEDSEDVSQQVFISVSNGLNGFKREKPSDSFRGWLRVVTRSRVMDFFRANSHREVPVGGTSFMERINSIVEQGDEVIGEERAETNILVERAMSLLQSEFSANDCKAFHMLVIDAIAPREVAEKLGLSLNSVYIAKSRILKRMRDEFDDLMDEQQGCDFSRANDVQ